MTEICYAKYNRTRAPKFQTKTILEKENGKKTIVKEAMNEEALEHIQSFQKKYQFIKQLYQNVEPVAVTLTENSARFEYIDGQTIASVLSACLNDKEKLLNEMKKYLDLYFQYEPEVLCNFEQTDEFQKVFGEYSKNCQAVKIANIDEIFDNLVLKDGNCYLIDYEWVFDFPVPVAYIRFRTLLYFYVNNNAYIQHIISMDEYMKFFGFGENEQKEWMELEDHFQQYAHGKDRQYIYTNNYRKNTYDIYQVLNLYSNIGETISSQDNLIRMKDHNISDYQANEKILNDIISSNKAENTRLQTQIGQLQEQMGHQAEYIRILRRATRNPFYAGYLLMKKIGKKVLPPLVQMGLYSLMTDGVRATLFKMKCYSNNKNQYDIWLEQNEKDTSYVEKLDYEPLISVIVPVYNVLSSQLIECIESVRNQTYKNWQLCLVDDCSTMPEVRETLEKYQGDPKIKIKYREKNGHISRATNSGFEIADGEFVALLDCDDLLAENALYEMAKKLNENPKYDFVYSDEDKITEDGTKRKDPFFKPDWSPDTFMSLMYTCHFAMFRKSLIDELGGMRIGLEGSQDYDLVLRVMEKTNQIGHIPKILYHWRERKESTANNMGAKPYIIESTKKAKLDALERRGLKGTLSYIKPIVMFRVTYIPQNDPKVSIVIPSKDNYQVLKQCIESIRSTTSYTNYEIIVVDNGSNAENKAKYEQLCADNQVQYHYEPMQFNFSKMCNIGAALATGEYLLFLNDDIEIRGEQWMSIMLGQAQVPYTGAVGCKLMYPGTNRIQHVGVLNLEIGPGHAFHGYDDDMNYYYGRNILDYNFAVVTGACLMVKKEKFDQVKGFDETLPVAYNDVELCFKLIEAGYYNVLRNDVKLIHHESISRGYDAMTPEKAERQRREMQHLYELHPKFKGYDPCYNPNLTQTRGDFSFELSKCSKPQTVSEVSERIEPQNAEVKFSIDEKHCTNEIRIAGWAFVKKGYKAGKVKILLVGTQRQYEVTTEEVFRPDVKAVNGNHKSLCFAGFQTNFAREKIATGEYKIYLKLHGKIVDTKETLNLG